MGGRSAQRRGQIIRTQRAEFGTEHCSDALRGFLRCQGSYKAGQNRGVDAAKTAIPAVMRRGMLIPVRIKPDGQGLIVMADLDRFCRNFALEV